MIGVVLVDFDAFGWCPTMAQARLVWLVYLRMNMEERSGPERWPEHLQEVVEAVDTTAKAGGPAWEMMTRMEVVNELDREGFEWKQGQADQWRAALLSEGRRKCQRAPMLFGKG